VWEFWGRGDPFFGGNADDRGLYEVEPRVYQFLSGPEAARRKLSPATFEDKVTAFQNGRSVCPEGRARGAVSGLRGTAVPYMNRRCSVQLSPRAADAFERSSASTLLPRRSCLEAAAQASGQFPTRTQALKWRATVDEDGHYSFAVAL
jgi:hypothetical protein